MWRSASHARQAVTSSSCSSGCQSVTTASSGNVWTSPPASSKPVSVRPTLFPPTTQMSRRATVPTRGCSRRRSRQLFSVQRFCARNSPSSRAAVLLRVWAASFWASLSSLRSSAKSRLAAAGGLLSVFPAAFRQVNVTFLPDTRSSAVVSPNVSDRTPCSFRPKVGTLSSSRSSRLSPARAASASSARSRSFRTGLNSTLECNRASCASTSGPPSCDSVYTAAEAVLRLRGPTPGTFLSDVSTRCPRTRAVSGVGGSSARHQTRPRRTSSLKGSKASLCRPRRRVVRGLPTRGSHLERVASSASVPTSCKSFLACFCQLAFGFALVAEAQNRSNARHASRC